MTARRRYPVDDGTGYPRDRRLLIQEVKKMVANYRKKNRKAGLHMDRVLKDYLR